MKKKILALCLVVVLAITAVTGATLAYFTDTDEDTNVFAVGNIKINQFEMQRDADGKLEAFANDKVVMPAAGDPKYAEGNYQFAGNGVSEELKKDLVGGNQLWHAQMNAQDKFVFVENTGNNNVYYRTIIAMECPEGITLRINANGNERFDWDAATAGQQNANVAKEYVVTTTDGVRYEVIVATYTDVLKVGEVSRPSLLQYALDKATTQEQIEKFGDDGIQVLTFTEAVQADGFKDLYAADTACNALKDAFGEIDEPYLQDLIAG